MDEVLELRITSAGTSHPGSGTVRPDLEALAGGFDDEVAIGELLAVGKLG